MHSLQQSLTANQMYRWKSYIGELDTHEEFRIPQFISSIHCNSRIIFQFQAELGEISSKTDSAVLHSQTDAHSQYSPSDFVCISHPHSWLSSSFYCPTMYRHSSLWYIGYLLVFVITFGTEYQLTDVQQLQRQCA